VRRIIRLQLTELGYPVIEAGDGLEARSLLEQVDDIAILVTDTVMPGGLNGRELAAHARALRPTLPILLITGYACQTTQDDGADRDIPVLRKPFDRAALERALRELAHHSARTSARP